MPDTIDPNPFLIIHATIAGAAAYVASHYVASRWQVVWTAFAAALGLSLLWAPTNAVLFVCLYEFVVELPSRLLYGRLGGLQWPDGEDVMGLLEGWLIPISVCYAIARYQFAKPIRRERFTLRKRVVVAVIFAALITYLVGNWDYPNYMLPE